MQWITFHSGYDFGYLLKVLTYTPLPPTEGEFFELLQVRQATFSRLLPHTSLKLHRATQARRLTAIHMIWFLHQAPGPISVGQG